MGHHWWRPLYAAAADSGRGQIDTKSRNLYTHLIQRSRRTDGRTDGQNYYINVARQHCCADAR